MVTFPTNSLILDLHIQIAHSEELSILIGFMNYKFKTKPYAHQLTALEKSWNRETYAYFMEMGTGKTKVLIDNAAMLYDKGNNRWLLLIVAPKGVIGTWYNQELPTHLPDHIENVTVLWQAKYY